jgi:enoyl-CoA hydratase/carnithine racemase
VIAAAHGVAFGGGFQILSGAEALAHGFVTHVSDDPLAHAMALASEIANKTPTRSGAQSGSAT